MSGYKGHIIFGLILAVILTSLIYMYNIFNLSIVQSISIFPIVFIYSLLPDMDIPSSKISWIIRIVALIFIIALILIDMKALAISICIAVLLLQFVKHRKFIHTITAGAIFSLPLLFFDYVIALFAFVVYLSHLLVDKKVKLI